MGRVVAARPRRSTRSRNVGRLARRRAVGALFGAAGSVASAAASATPPRAPDWAFGQPAAEVALFAVSAVSLTTFLLPQARRGWGPDEPSTYDYSSAELSDLTGATVGVLVGSVGTYLAEAAYYDEVGVDGSFTLALRTSLIDFEAIMLAT